MRHTHRYKYTLTNFKRGTDSSAIAFVCTQQTLHSEVPEWMQSAENLLFAIHHFHCPYKRMCRVMLTYNTCAPQKLHNNTHLQFAYVRLSRSLYIPLYLYETIISVDIVCISFFHFIHFCQWYLLFSTSERFANATILWKPCYLSIYLSSSLAIELNFGEGQ